MSLNSTTRRDLAITAGGIGGQSTAYSDYSTAVKLWRALYGDLADGWLVIWTKTHGIHPYQVADVVAAAGKVAELAPVADVYFSVCLQRQRPPAGARGEAAGVVAVPALWDDLDALTPGHHKGDNLPSMMQLEDFVADLPLQPSAVVHSGGGLQAYWFLAQPAIIGDEDERAQIAALSRGWQAAIQRRAQAHGWKFDNTSDLARVLRVPGAFNRKTRDVKPVKLLYLDPARRYSLGELQACIEAEPVADVPPVAPVAQVDPVDPVAHINGNGKAQGNGKTPLATFKNNPGAFWLEKAIGWSRDGSRDGRNEAGFHLAGQLRDEGLTEGEAWDEMQKYQRAVKDAGDHEYTEREALASLKSAYRLPTRDRAEAQGVKPSTRSTNEPAAVLVTGSYRLTDYGNAERFVARHGRDVRYCKPWKKWLVWDGRRWTVDERGEVGRRAKETIRSIYAEASTVEGEGDEDKKRRKDIAAWALRSESGNRTRELLERARDDERIVVTPGDLDADPWLFNVMNGTIDLRTGDLLAHDPAQLITRLAPVEYDPVACSDVWEDMVDKVTGGDAEYAQFLQRAVGYSLTSSITEKAIFLLLGSKDTGKSTFVEALAAAWGDYGAAMDWSTLSEQTREDGKAPRPDLVRLRGRRLVTAAEGRRGSRLDAALIKRLTGGDTVLARGLNEDPVEFVPIFKLWLSTNHPPELDVDDEAVWRRVFRLEFKHTFAPWRGRPQDEPKVLLKEDPAHRSAILAWAVQGCLSWQRHGLQPPAVVTKDTEAYRDDVDHLRDYLEARCLMEPGNENIKTPREEVYQNYLDWAYIHKVRKADVMSDKEFSRRLKDRYAIPTKSIRDPAGRTVRGYVGLGLLLKPSVVPPSGDDPATGEDL